MSYGYGKGALRINLSEQSFSVQKFEENELRKFIGGSGLGAKILIEEVDPKASWDHPSNKIIMATGPFSGTRVSGSGTFSVVTKGAMTEGATSSQANGFFGAYLKLCGWDAVVLEGASEKWVYVFINGDSVEFRDATRLLGLDTWELQDAIKQELGNSRVRVFGIGPAGENLVRFACLVGDEGHVVSKNGVGAVFGSKKVKAIVVARGSEKIDLYDEEKFTSAAKKLSDQNNATPLSKSFQDYGTAAVVPALYSRGALPIKNYTTNVLEEHEKLSGEYIRGNFKLKPQPCWGCTMKSHCHLVELDNYKGMKLEEPEYEGMAGMGSNLGITDTQEVIYLCNLADRLGVDINEASWVISWTMECYEKGVFSKEKLGGLDLTWGNANAVKEILKKIANREGIGQLLAEGTKRAAQQVGEPAKSWAIYTEKGNTPRGHDHRAVWFELLDTCVSNTGTIESTGRRAQPEQLGLEPASDPFDWEQVVKQNAALNGRRLFEDSLGVCGFCVDDLNLIIETLNAATGWDIDIEEALEIGHRIINVFRIFNINSGIENNTERPSQRYGSVPVDGPAKGKDIMAVWPQMLNRYYELMCWDTKTGYPLPERLKRLKLEKFIPLLK